MDKNTKILLAILIAVACLQVVHFASAAKTLDYVHILDDKKRISYEAGDSSTKASSYRITFTIIVAAVTLILQGLLLVGKCRPFRMGEKIEEIMYGFVAAMQFALGVLLAIDQSRQINPNGPNASPITLQNIYRDFYNTQLADIILIWVICVPGSYLLVHYHAMTDYGKEKDNQMGVTA